MVRVNWVACAALAVVGASLVAAADPDESRLSLPIRKIVLFNTGVGYFEHRGGVDGQAVARLPVDIDDMNDLLKSLVLDDEGGGRIGAVVYEAKDPLAQQLERFSIDLGTQPTLAEVLQQLRGERVHVTGKTDVEGVIIGLEAQDRAEGGQVIDVEMLNLLTDKGLRSVPLATVENVELLDAELNRELQAALQLLATGRRARQRHLSLTFHGEGPRQVRVGYMRQTPVWKTSYRLVLSNATTQLQGWALVENTSDVAWDAVQLSLISGQPIGFRMDLYEPLYVDRPLLPVPLAGTPRPQPYDRGIPAPSRGAWGFGGGGLGGGGMGGGMGGFGGGGGEPQETSVETLLDPTRAVTAQAAGRDVADLFQYELKTPVSVPARQSALLPIVDGEVACERLSIFTAGGDDQRPLRGLRLTNATANHLAPGPLAVFDQSVFAGETRLPHLPPGERRLLSYAVDLEATVVAATASHPTQLVTATIASNQLELERLESRTITYTLTYRGRELRALLIEHPRPKEAWTVVEPPEPLEATDTLLRYPLALTPEQPAELRVVEQHTVVERKLLAALTPEELANLIAAAQVPEGVKERLRALQSTRLREAALLREKTGLDARRSAILQEQSRIRANMQVLDRTSGLYEDYVATLKEQEKELAQLDKQLQDTADKIRQLQEESPFD